MQPTPLHIITGTSKSVRTPVESNFSPVRIWSTILYTRIPASVHLLLRWLFAAGGYLLSQSLTQNVAVTLLDSFDVQAAWSRVVAIIFGNNHGTRNYVSARRVGVNAKGAIVRGARCEPRPPAFRNRFTVALADFQTIEQSRNMEPINAFEKHFKSGC